MNKFFTIILILAIAMGATSCGNEKNNQEGTTTTEKSSSGSDSIKTFTVNGVEFKMIKVEGGTFTMGATDNMVDEAQNHEFPTHNVALSTYYIGQIEVTQELWVAVMDNNPSKFKGSKLPVEMLTWVDSQKFITKLNQLTGEQFRLPTEAEWEFAARGGNKSKKYKYCGGNVLEDLAWFGDNSGGKTHEVGTKRANELGIFDMSGNVWEWCGDWYGSYNSSQQENPTGPDQGSERVIRGGGWNDGASYCRISNRLNWDAENRSIGNLGLRLAM